MKIFTPEHGFVRNTRQYVGGMVSGFGLCAFMMKFLILSQGTAVLGTPLFFMGAFFLIAVGGSLALSEQRRIEADRKKNQQPPSTPSC
jgi:hypothetical protein